MHESLICVPYQVRSWRILYSFSNSHLFGVTKVSWSGNIMQLKSVFYSVTISLQSGDTSWSVTLLYSHGMPFFLRGPN